MPQERLDKRLAEGFAEFYDEIRDSEYILQGLLQKGKTLTDEDINIFWATFKTAQKEAFMNGARAILD